MATITPQPGILQRLPVSKPSRGEIARIARIGEMDDRHKILLAMGDRGGLMELATEYASLGNHGGCTRMASHIRMEANLLNNKPISKGESNVKKHKE